MTIATEARRLVRMAWLALLLFAAPAAWAGGTLVIVGGALQPDNAAVHRAFIEALPGQGQVVIIPAASGQPWRSAQDIRDDLLRHGLGAERIEIYPLALLDDSASDNQDESQWAQNAWAAERVQALGQPAGFWLTGGDQVRIIAALVDAERRESDLLRLMRERLAAGAVIGGTSAGAAVMSRRMIAGGTSFEALLQPPAEQYESIEDQDSGRLFLADGLGFLPVGIVDQHFDRKARLGRLVRALGLAGESLGYGVDENTAMVVDLDSQVARVVGAGAVTLLDARKAQFEAPGGLLAGALELSLAPADTRFGLADLALDGALGAPTRGNEYYGYAPLQGGGMAFANARLDQALGHDLLDNHASDHLQRYSLDSSGRMLVYSFSETEHSQGYWLRHPGGARYAIARVRLDIHRRGWLEAPQAD